MRLAARMHVSPAAPSTSRAPHPHVAFGVRVWVSFLQSVGTTRRRRGIARRERRRRRWLRPAAHRGGCHAGNALTQPLDGGFGEDAAAAAVRAGDLRRCRRSGATQAAAGDLQPAAGWRPPRELRRRRLRPHRAHRRELPQPRPRKHRKILTPPARRGAVERFRARRLPRRAPGHLLHRCPRPSNSSARRRTPVGNGPGATARREP